MRRPVQVTVVEQRGDSVVVQWRRVDKKGTDAGAARTLVPASCVEEGCVDAADLRAGVAMSVDWAGKYRSRLTGAHLAAELERLGIWTVDDLRHKALPAQRAVARTAVEDLYDMLRRLGCADPTLGG